MSRTAPRLHGNRSPAHPASGPRRPNATVADNATKSGLGGAKKPKPPRDPSLRLITQRQDNGCRLPLACFAHARKAPLFHFYRSPCLGELLLDILGLVLGDAFLNGLGSAVHQVLGFLQAQI